MRLDDGRVLPNFMGQALRGEPLTVYGDGSQTRSFCYVADLVDGICRLLVTDFHEPVNLGNPDEVTILEFAEEILELVGQQEPDRLSAAAAGRPEGAQAGHHARAASCSAGSRRSTAARDAADAGVFPRKGGGPVGWPMRLGRGHVVYTALAFVVAASAVILYLAYVGRCPLRENARHVRRDDGRRGGACPRSADHDAAVPRREIRIWRTDQTQCMAFFDADGKVSRLDVHDVPRPSVLCRLLGRLGLPW